MTVKNMYKATDTIFLKGQNVHDCFVNVYISRVGNKAIFEYGFPHRSRKSADNCALGEELLAYRIVVKRKKKGS